jgi:hypothetical protein
MNKGIEGKSVSCVSIWKVLHKRFLDPPVKPRGFEMGVSLTAARIKIEMSLGAAIIPSPHKPFKQLISYFEDRFLFFYPFNPLLGF